MHGHPHRAFIGAAARARRAVGLRKNGQHQRVGGRERKPGGKCIDQARLRAAHDAVQRRDLDARVEQRRRRRVVRAGEHKRADCVIDAFIFVEHLLEDRTQASCFEPVARAPRPDRFHEALIGPQRQGARVPCEDLHAGRVLRDGAARESGEPRGQGMRNGRVHVDAKVVDDRGKQAAIGPGGRIRQARVALDAPRIPRRIRVRPCNEQAAAIARVRAFGSAQGPNADPETFGRDAQCRDGEHDHLGAVPFVRGRIQCFDRRQRVGEFGQRQPAAAQPADRWAPIGGIFSKAGVGGQRRDPAFGALDRPPCDRALHVRRVAVVGLRQGVGGGHPHLHDVAPRLG